MRITDLVIALFSKKKVSRNDSLLKLYIMFLRKTMSFLLSLKSRKLFYRAIRQIALLRSVVL